MVVMLTIVCGDRGGCGAEGPHRTGEGSDVGPGGQVPRLSV